MWLATILASLAYDLFWQFKENAVKIRDLAVFICNNHFY
jgi:hypothetical protein